MGISQNRVAITTKVQNGSGSRNQSKKNLSNSSKRRTKDQGYINLVGKVSSVGRLVTQKPSQSPVTKTTSKEIQINNQQKQEQKGFPLDKQQTQSQQQLGMKLLDAQDYQSAVSKLRGDMQQVAFGGQYMLNDKNFQGQQNRQIPLNNPNGYYPLTQFGNNKQSQPKQLQTNLFNQTNSQIKITPGRAGGPTQSRNGSRVKSQNANSGLNTQIIGLKNGGDTMNSKLGLQTMIQETNQNVDMLNSNKNDNQNPQFRSNSHMAQITGGENSQYQMQFARTNENIIAQSKPRQVIAQGPIVIVGNLKVNKQQPQSRNQNQLGQRINGAATQHELHHQAYFTQEQQQMNALRADHNQSDRALLQRNNQLGVKLDQQRMINNNSVPLQRTNQQNGQAQVINAILGVERVIDPISGEFYSNTYTEDEILNEQNKKVLFANVSLRERSNPTKRSRNFDNTSQQDQNDLTRLSNTQDHSSGIVEQSQNTQIQLRQVLQQKESNIDSKNKNNPILNIKQVKDINIYNNSFILNAAVPNQVQNNGNLQQVQQALLALQDQSQIQNLSNITQVSQSKINIVGQNSINQMQAYQQANDSKLQNQQQVQHEQKLNKNEHKDHNFTGLKLRKQLPIAENKGKISNLQRSSSQQANNSGQPFEVDYPQIRDSQGIYDDAEIKTYNIGKNGVSLKTSHQSEGKTDSIQSNNKNVMHHILNMYNNTQRQLAQNPNQKRVLLASNQTGHHQLLAKTSSSQETKQKQLNRQTQILPSVVYYADGQKGQGLNNYNTQNSQTQSSEVLAKASSITTRLQSRGESRNKIHQENEILAQGENIMQNKHDKNNLQILENNQKLKINEKINKNKVQSITKQGQNQIIEERVLLNLNRKNNDSKTREFESGSQKSQKMKFIESSSTNQLSFEKAKQNMIQGPMAAKEYQYINKFKNQNSNDSNNKQANSRQMLSQNLSGSDRGYTQLVSTGTFLNHHASVEGITSGDLRNMNSRNIINSMTVKKDSLLVNKGQTTLNKIKTNLAQNKVPQNGLEPSPLREKNLRQSYKVVQELDSSLKGLIDAAKKLMNQITQQFSKQNPDAKNAVIEGEGKNFERQMDKLLVSHDQLQNLIRRKQKESTSSFLNSTGNEIQEADESLNFRFSEIFQKSQQEAILLKLSKATLLADQKSSLEGLKLVDQAIKEADQLRKQLISAGNKSSSFSKKQVESNFTSLELLKTHQPQNNIGINLQEIERRFQFALIFKAELQRRTGDHQNSILSLTDCIQEFPQFKEALFIRGQIYLSTKNSAKALRDFQQYYEIISVNNQQILSKDSQQQRILDKIQAKQAMADTYKKLKQMKFANQFYQDCLDELQQLLNQKEKPSTSTLHDYQLIEAQIHQKIGMTLYYQGQMQSAVAHLQQSLIYFSQFKFEEHKVQNKLIKTHYYIAKAIISAGGQHLDATEINGTIPFTYGQALKHLNFILHEDIEPEQHELYCGNALFEIAKIFLKQKDFLNANEFIQRATSNNYNSKRLSLYRDFAEGVVQLMKRKIKKGVQILTDLLEVVINGQKETLKGSFVNKKQPNRYEEGKQAQSLDHQTISAKSNQFASGKFDKLMCEYLIFNIYIFRAYGYVAIEKYEHALDDFQRAKKLSRFAIDRASIYNKWLSRGILKMDTEEYLMASRYFSKASLRFPQNKDSFCLNIISIVRSYSFSLQGKFIDEKQKITKIFETKQLLDVAIETCSISGKQPSLYYFRGLLNFHAHNFYEALQDFNLAIEQEEEPTGQFHLARGRTYACLSILDEALKELTIALEQDQSLLEAYLFRGKCAHLLGDNNLAFHDFQKLILTDQKNPMVHIYAGNLLMTTGAYQDAIKAFDNSDTVQTTALAAFQRIRCYCALSDLEKAFEQMQLCKHMAPAEKFSQYDYKVLLSILSCTRSFEFLRSDPDDSKTERAKGVQEHTSIIETCIKQISSVLVEFENDEHLKIEKSQSPMSIQIIPNVDRIKIEKNIVFQQLKSAAIAKARGKKNEKIQFSLKNLSQEEKKTLNSIKSYDYYRENIFNLEDMYLFRAVFNMYLQKFELAITDFAKSWNTHQAQKRLEQQESSKLKSDQQKDSKTGINTMISPINSAHSFGSQNTENSDIGFCSLNFHEYNYNQVICLMAQGNFEEAINKITESLASVQPNIQDPNMKNIKQLFLVRALAHQALGKSDQYKNDLNLFMKHFQKVQRNKDGVIEVKVFDNRNRLCQQFEPIKIVIPDNLGLVKQIKGQKAQEYLLMRPSFSMPFIKPPNMIPNIDEEGLQGEFNLKQIDAPMPEAPWVRQCHFQQFAPAPYFEEDSEKKGTIEEWLDVSNLKKNKASLNKDKQQTFTEKLILYTSVSSTQDQKVDLNLLFDPELQKEIEEISDQDKVSLISDVELIAIPDQGFQSNSSLHGNSGQFLNKAGNLDQQQKGRSKTQIKERAADLQNTTDQKNKLNLRTLSEIEFKGIFSVKKTENGLKLNRMKYICRRKRSCSSCYRMPIDPDYQNIGNQEILIKNLRMSSDTRRKARRNMVFKGGIPASEILTAKEETDLLKECLFEDTISEHQSVHESESEKKKHQSQHSRFSSNVGDLSDLLDLQEHQNEIDDQAIFIGSPSEKTKKRNQKQDSPKGKQKDNNHKMERESMVVLASVEVNKLGQRAIGASKEKSVKVGGLGGMASLKNNKLAIAFNNLEVDNDEQDSQ